MSADTATSYNIHLGSWTDWSRGPVYGATLTLTGKDGKLLIGFLAVFVTIVGTRFWRVVCLILHYTYSSNQARDGIYQQRQALLRNAPNPETALWTLADMSFSWRDNAQKLRTRLLPLLGLALACMVGFTIGGGFSSHVAILGSAAQVLLSGENCSLLRTDRDFNSVQDSEGYLDAQRLNAAESYARQCYLSSVTEKTLSCGTFVKKQITPAILDTNASCPFDNKICKKSSGNLFIDTGLLDSYDDHGRNTPPNRRMKFRRTVRCAPLATDGYRIRRFDEARNQSYTKYYYGPTNNLAGPSTNFTAQFSHDTYAYPDPAVLVGQSGDTLDDFSVRKHYASWYKNALSMSSSFFPVPELGVQDSSIFIFFLSSPHILFAFPSHDDWFMVTGNTTEIPSASIGGRKNVTYFRQSEPGTPLACKEQEQFCFTGARGQQRCTELQAPYQADRSLMLMRDEGDEEWIYWFHRTSYANRAGTAEPLQYLGIQPLLVRARLNGPLIGTIPDNQWQTEVLHWHSTAMAHLQASFLLNIIGFSDPKQEPFIVRPNTTDDKMICESQKILSEGFVSISILAIGCIFGVGTLIILLSLTLEPILSWYIERTGRYRYAHLEWSTNETLQLQRQAHEGSGVGTWSCGTESIPITKPGDLLAVLDLSNPKHPRLRAFRPVNEEQQTGRRNDDLLNDVRMDEDDKV